MTGAVFHRTKIWQSATACLFTYVFLEFFIHQPALTDGKNASEFKENDVAAIVEDVPIFNNEIEAPIAGRLYLLQKDIFLLKRRQLDVLVQKRLVELEARNQGISPQELSAKIIENAPKVTIADIDAYYHQNLDKLSGIKKSTPEIKQQIEAYLINVKRDKAIRDYITPLFEKYAVTNMYQPPKLPTANVDITDSPSWGPFDAKVTIVEFSDYLCPSCRKAHVMTKKIKEKYKGKIRWIFKDYPLPKHKGADYLAMAARCAGDQNRFWEFQDILFDYKKKNISRDDLMNDAASLELDIDRFALCLDNRKYFSAVQKDMKEVDSVGVNATPTFIINGKLHPGAPDEQTFSVMIEKDLN